MGIVGLYGVLEYAASQRRREIGLRMALGAEPGPLTAVLMRRGVTLAVVGVFIGVAVASATTRFLSSLLFHTSPVDPTTYVTVSLALIATAAWASYQPARRATRVSPVIAMRPE
jgi:ABC-type antimicrobial peptide transport system permease subunit